MSLLGTSACVEVTLLCGQLRPEVSLLKSEWERGRCCEVPHSFICSLPNVYRGTWGMLRWITCNVAIKDVPAQAEREKVKRQWQQWDKRIPSWSGGQEREHLRRELRMGRGQPGGKGSKGLFRHRAVCLKGQKHGRMQRLWRTTRNSVWPGLAMWGNYGNGTGYEAGEAGGSQIVTDLWSLLNVEISPKIVQGY